MDRAIVYAGSIPLDTDLLRVGKYGKAAIGHMSDMLYGRGVVAASGLACTPSSSSLAVTIGAGSITAPGVMDATAFGGAGGGYRADPTQTTCQYSSDTAVTVTVPGTGASYTVFAICAEQDIDQTVLAFFNAANPSQTQAGLNNSGDVLPTRRWAGMSFVIATDAPAAPAGGTVVPLYTLTVPQGVTSLAGVRPQPGQAFWPTIPELATQTLLRAIAEPMQLVANDTSLSVPAWATRVELRVIGGGGGGASSSSTLLTGSFSGGGGGGGGDAWGIYGVSPTSGGVLGVTIGRGAPQSRQEEHPWSATTGKHFFRPVEAMVASSMTTRVQPVGTVVLHPEGRSGIRPGAGAETVRVTPRPLQAMVEMARGAAVAAAVIRLAVMEPVLGQAAAARILLLWRVLQLQGGWLLRLRDVSIFAVMAAFWGRFSPSPKEYQFNEMSPSAILRGGMAFRSFATSSALTAEALLPQA